MYNFASPVGKFEIDWLKCVFLSWLLDGRAEGGIYEPDQTVWSMFIDNKWRLGHQCDASKDVKSESCFALMFVKCCCPLKCCCYPSRASSYSFLLFLFIFIIYFYRMFKLFIWDSLFYMDLLVEKKMLNKMLLNWNQQLSLKNCIFFLGESLKCCS